MPYDEIRYLNQAYLEDITSGNIKVAQENTDNFLRLRVREDGAARRILPPEPVTPDDYVPDLEHDQPQILVEMEPRAAGAIVAGFGDLTPPTQYIQGKRFRVVLQRVFSPRLRKDVMELETYRADIRQLLAEMLVKDLSWKEDAAFIEMCNTLLGGSAGSTNIMSGEVQWVEMPGGVSRVTLGDAFKRTFDPASRIPIRTILTNAATASELWKWERPEVGGDAAQEILFEGWGERKLNDCDVIMTIKKELVPNDTFFMFGDPRFIGKFYIRKEPSLYIELKDEMVSFYASEIIGAAIGHGDGVFRFDFVTS